MKSNSNRSVLLLFVVAFAAMSQVSNAFYFYAMKNKERCFSDTVVKNNTLEMEVQILDEDVLNQLV